MSSGDDELKIIEDPSGDCLTTHKNVDELSQSPCQNIEGISPSLGPTTPTSDRENGDFRLTLLKKENQSPHQVSCLGLTKHKHDEACVHHNYNPQTPKDSVFDSFAPGPCDLAFAPLTIKYLNDSAASVARRLYFDSSVVLDDNDEQSDTDIELFEAVYQDLLEVIVFEQVEGDKFTDQLSNDEAGFDHSLTPTLQPRLNGVPQACPGAPIKHSRRSRNINLGLCRKLEF